MTENVDSISNANSTGEINDTFAPYVPATESPLEFTLKAALTGIIFGILFGAANAYLGLKVGLTISTSIPVAVMTVAAFRALQKLGSKSTILEANMSQTIGSASSSLASGVIFTLPALFLWGLDPSLIQMVLLALFGGLLGILFMVPLRKYLIEKEHGKLPYPEGTACAEVLIASEVGGSKAKNVFLGLGIGAFFKFIFGWLKVFPSDIAFKVPFINKSELSVDMSAALFGVGYILGPRIASIMVGGSLLSWVVIIPVIAAWGQSQTIPLFPETIKLIADMDPHLIWTRYVRYIGAGAVATGGIITLIRSIPTMINSFKIGAQQIKKRIGTVDAAIPRTSIDLSLKTVLYSVVAIGFVMAIVPFVFGPITGISLRLLGSVLVVLFAFFFVTVSSRIVGLVGVTSNPTSGMTIATLLGTSSLFLLLGWTGDIGKAASITVGCVVAIAASIAGDTSQDLKTGFLLGATPRKQQIGEIIGALTSATFVCLSVLLLDKVYGFGTSELAAPQATLMKIVIEGVLEKALPWLLVGIGVIIAITVELFRIPSLPFAVGVYLPVATMMTVFLGGVLRWFMEKTSKTDKNKENRREHGILFGSGLVGGEGLMGVAIAAVAFIYKQSPPAIGTEWAGAFAPIGAILILIVFIKYFASRCDASK
ncbi:OPT family oligopeptide transporter [Candidatus Neomarinimicrobiota bacterium]